MKLKCIKEIGGFTVGNTYDLLGRAGEYVQLKDDNGEIYILNEGCFIVDDSKLDLPKPPEPEKIVERNELCAIGLFIGILVTCYIVALLIKKFGGA